MRNYELAIVIDPTLESDAVEGILERVNRLITEDGGLVQGIDRWGRRRLAYEIDGHREGNYFFVNFQANPALSIELERVMRITDGVLRYLLVKQGDS